ncbi:MAG TPA: Panacea domain-containing protein [Xanthobacteraceae bacterium]|nr:Panacea domain-containing protein [Xanthobacteraceae bacterium]
MQYDRAKLKTVILYACLKCGPAQLGAVKLHKVLYFTDMIYYANTGVPVTGATYRKSTFGPTCDQLLVTLSRMAREKALEVREVDYFGYRKKEYTALESPEIERLNETEITLLDEVIEFVCFNNTAKTISEFSHNRAWELARHGDILKYNSVFQIYPTEVSPETMDWATAEIKAIEEQRSSGEAVASIPFASLRKKVLEDLRNK